MQKKIKVIGIVLCMLILLCACSETENNEPADTTAPEVTIKQNTIFTNNIDAIDLTLIADVTDESTFSLSLCKFQKLDDLKVLDESTLKGYTSTIVDTNDTEGLLKRTDDLPNGDGIYSAVYVVEDAYGHKTAKEVIVIYDSQTPLVSGTDDMNVEVEVKDPTAEWTKTYIENISFSDNVDGQITKDMLNVNMELTDKDNHVYTVKADYTDRAGNKTSVEYTITLVKKKETTSNNGGNTNNGGNNNGGGSNNGGTTNDNNKDDSGNETQGYSYEDRDGDGFADLGETTVMNGFVVWTDELTPKYAKELLAVANAGYYNIICVNGNYWVLVKAGDYETGFTMMDEYFEERNLGCTSMEACYFDVNRVAQYIVVYKSDVYEIK